MPVSNDFLTQELEDQKEAWKADHDNAMECYALQDKLSRGLGLFHVIRLTDESWSRKVQAGTAPFDPDTVRQIHDAYVWWLRPCATILKQLEHAERTFEVEGAPEFRRCWRMAKHLVEIEPDELIEAMAQVERGETFPLDEEEPDALHGTSVPGGQTVHATPAKRRPRRRAKRAG